MWNGGNSGESDILKNCYMSALKLAFESGCKSIAFPLIATGFYGFPRELGMEIAVDSFTKFLEEFEMDIILVVYDGNDFNVHAYGSEVLHKGRFRIRYFIRRCGLMSHISFFVE